MDAPSYRAKQAAEGVPGDRAGRLPDGIQRGIEDTGEGCFGDGLSGSVKQLVQITEAVPEDEAGGEEKTQDIGFILAQRDLGDGAWVGTAPIQAVSDLEEALVIAPHVDLSETIDDSRVLTFRIESEDGVVAPGTIEVEEVSLHERASACDLLPFGCDPSKYRGNGDLSGRIAESAMKTSGPLAMLSQDL